ncbi:MAG: response regulator, partial [Bacilli bacterium]|nr:response regulator [Bacilli bacterium]
MKKNNILMIDDNINLIEMVKEYFKYDDNINICLESHDGLEGIEIISNNLDNIDLIILDLIMPKKDGIYVLDEMRRRGFNKKVIVATSYNAAEVIREVSE